MKVSTNRPFQIVYSVFEHEYLGYLFESFVVQLDDNGGFTFQFQNISSKNASEFQNGLDEKDYQLIQWMDTIQQDAIVQKYATKKMKPDEFFSKIYDKEKGNKQIQELISIQIEGIRRKIIPELRWKLLFEMGNDGNPTWSPIEIMPQKATVMFHFFKNEDNTHYFPTIRYDGQKLEYNYKNAYLVCDFPACMVLEGKLYSFEGDVDGKKLKPFFKKKFIVIPANLEDTYFRKFVAPLIQQFNVNAKGFDIQEFNLPPNTILEFTEMKAGGTADLFGGKSSESEDQYIRFDLKFEYGDKQFFASPFYETSVVVDKTDKGYTFKKYHRNKEFEKEIRLILAELKLPLHKGTIKMARSDAFEWLSMHAFELEQKGIMVLQNESNDKRYFSGYSSIDIEIKENIDWFDINGVVTFGDFTIPFSELRKLMLKNQREFKLPNGLIAIIPDAWFRNYSDLLYFSEENSKGSAKLNKIHLSLLDELQNGNLAKISIDHKLNRLRDFEQIEDYPMPVGFKGELRPYQKAGYNWLRFLSFYRFGGCLADDMGLGKTVQTLAMLQAEKEKKVPNPSLLVVPTSLIYNWELESSKFTPELKILVYAGTNRSKREDQFAQYDLVITSYGIVRQDIDMLDRVHFHYVILDESQAIKNPSANIAKAVKRFNARHRLVLTGTPIENSTLDLWSQVSFVNPGLLGTQSFFKKEYQLPIENKKDEVKLKKLHSLIKPFVLRRKKSQVATELPEKIENIKYCQMTPEQEEAYEEVKNGYREQIIENIEKKGMNNSHMLIIQGLTKLRQLANHPKMVDSEYEGDSGKMEDIIMSMQKVIDEGHKILVFSQFVKHLTLIREHLEKEKIKYAYLDGATKDRQAAVNDFTVNDDMPVFLISLKAGGLGLNLTMADYVFILDPWWNPAAEAQAVDRAHRIGQTNTVFSYKFITRGTVEEKILKLQERKMALAQDLITTEESFVKKLTTEDVMALLD